MYRLLCCVLKLRGLLAGGGNGTHYLVATTVSVRRSLSYLPGSLPGTFSLLVFLLKPLGSKAQRQEGSREADLHTFFYFLG